MSPQSSGLKNKPSKKTNMKQLASRGDSFLGLFIDPEYGGDMFLRNIN
jgi:hypothetical protein